MLTSSRVVWPQMFFFTLSVRRLLAQRKAALVVVELNVIHEE